MLQDERPEAAVSVTALMPDPAAQLEPGEVVADDASAAAESVASQKQEEVVIDRTGKTRDGNPMVDFQLLDYERRHEPRRQDPTYKGFSYGEPKFLPKDFIEQHYRGGADRRAARMNPTGTADAAFDCLLPHRLKKVDITVQAEQSVMLPTGQQGPKLVRSTVPLTMTDVEPEQALRMILPRCAPGFFPGTQVFTNAGDAGGQLVRDRARLVKVTRALRKEMVLLPPDYLQGTNGTNRKPALYVTVRVVKYLEEYQDLFIDVDKEEGKIRTIPYHPNAQP
ncbi:MAG: hypothetical protein GY832_39060, partial [Chloroflexi bacterium]|nr:hypothetical protein [Chloroflexota bacterium]